ncbi:VOC family protein [Tenggerimyces flavus]|uniref:VOC family protein n=1 Tax=Tenggerimyces flavus TaxID=1708749 RepID=A0ABV7Y8T7_9ACTN|nr:VOC family protein [Tenggerimyces flavus]MBM7783721.1 catechol 2,3-dioxygenase-like lactoylglutathione lyase family enzyme [Tenggerimyces flavus]
MRVKLAGIFVDDQERARAFYTEKLGFQVKTDAPYSETARWLTVVSADDPDGTELQLAPLNDAARTFQQALYSAGQPATALASEDCKADYDRLLAAGVTFTLEPTTMPYGGTDAVFDDTCGNLICIHQE